MTNAQKIEILETLLADSGEVPGVNTLNSYLLVSEHEILAWMYHLIGGVPDGVTEVPTKYDGTQIYAVIAGYTHAGAEGQSTHIENGVHRVFNYDDMLGYIHNHVLPYVRVGAVT